MAHLKKSKVSRLVRGGVLGIVRRDLEIVRSFLEIVRRGLEIVRSDLEIVPKGKSLLGLGGLFLAT